MRNRRIVLRSLPLLLIAGLLALCAQAFAADPFANNSSQSSVVAHDEFLPVEQAYRLDVGFRDERIALRWEIAEGYYLYRHQFAFNTDDGTTLLADLPAGKGKEDEFFGHVEVYYHAVEPLIAKFPQQPFTLAVTSQGCADAGLCYPPRTEYFRVDPIAKTIAATAAPAMAKAPTPPPASGSGGGWLAMLGLALLGGMILNLMPCVFPVLSLKVLSFAGHRDRSAGLHGLSYTVGVVASFLAVAALLLALKAAGQAVGWGFQLQQPWFVGALAYLFFAMGLSLSGFWELSGQWVGAGSNLAGRGGYSGSFFTGVLATLVASPCTAPFMSTALGFAVTQPPAQSLAVFAALGLGMALPVLVLALHPRLLAYIPKPGPWMERFKQALAFPLYATAIWLCWIVGRQVGASGMAVVLAGALALTLALWLWRFGWAGRSIAAASVVLALALLGSPLLGTAAQQPQAAASEDWQPYSAATLATLRAAGKPVFLNVTADWCITCLTNEKVALSSDSVKAAFTKGGIIYLKGDWTHYDPEITALLGQYGRSGIPLYIYFPADSRAAPVVLPQLLTPASVVAALASTETRS